ncbi:MAG TPA: OmpA family protein [Gemmatimonadales bacterium]|jgi:peptidoglycan-associated lipoprotein|nr:OmpA family protein [Gemmatimonadales bacterium]
MNRRYLMVALLGLTTIATACHHKPPVVAPTPTKPAPPPPTGPDTAALNRHILDSIANARAAAAAAAAAQAARDSAAAAAATQREANAAIGAMIHFDYNKAEISSADGQKLDAKAAVMKSHPTVRIRITGNCDERGSDDYNIALGTRRAAAAKEYLVRAGIDASRIDVASLGREKPLDPGHDENAWSRNRRDEFEVIAGQQALGNP